MLVPPGRSTKGYIRLNTRSPMWTTLAFSKMTAASPPVWAGPPELGRDDLPSKLPAPHAGESRVGIDMVRAERGRIGLGRLLRALGRLELEVRHVRLSDEHPRRRLEYHVSPRVVHVVVRVDRRVDHPAAYPRDAPEAGERGVRELRVHDRKRVLR